MDSNPLPPPETQTSAADARPPRSRTQKLLMGCGCGCAVLLTLVIGSMFWAFNYFIAGAGVQVPSHYVLGPKTAAFIHIAPAADDEPTRELITSLMETLASLDPEDFDPETEPGLHQMVQSFQDFDPEAAGQLLDVFPDSLTLALEVAPDPPSQLDVVGALNLSAGSRLVRIVIERFSPDGITIDEHGEHKIYSDFPGALDAAIDELEEAATQAVEPAPPSDFVTFQHDTLMFGSSLAMLTRTLDRTDFDEVPGPPPPSPLRGAFGELSERWLVSAGAGGEVPMPPGLFALLLEGLPESVLPLSEEARAWLQIPQGGFRLGAGISGGDLTMRVELTELDASGSEAVETGLTALFDNLAGLLEEQQLSLSRELLAGDGSIVVNARLDGFREWLNGKLRALGDR